MNKLLIVAVLGLLLVGSVSAYYCIGVEDKPGVAEFKSKVNLMALKEDVVNNHITPEAHKLKLKYFSNCE